MNDALRILHRAAPVMPVAHFQNLAHAQACAELFAEAKVPTVEVTLRHPQAWQMVKIFKDIMPFAKIGVGTVVNRRQMLRAADEADFKCFPAAAIGGVGLIKALSAPFPDVTFCPTGGISPSNYQEYLALESVACVGGSWIVPSEDALNKDRAGFLAMLKDLYAS